MNWVLMLTLWNFEHGPLHINPVMCLHIQARVAAGMWVVVEREDGTSTILRRARCIRQKTMS